MMTDEARRQWAFTEARLVEHIRLTIGNTDWQYEDLETTALRIDRFLATGHFDVVDHETDPPKAW